MSPNSIVKSPETDLQPIIDAVVKRRNLTKCDSSIQYGHVKGDGYIGIVTAVKLEGYNKNGEKEIFNLVLKTAPKNEKLREGAPIREAFIREVYFYDAIYPIFEDLQEEINVKNRFNSICECLATSTSKYQEALALRNLKDLGFSLWDRKVPMNEDHVSLVMKEYGKLHAMSFALREKNKSAFDKIASDMDINIFNEFMKQSNNLFEVACDNALKGFCKDKEGKLYDALLRFKGEIHQFLFEDVLNIDEYSAILHGDCWTNNMMFKYEDATNKPSTMCFIDFQVSRLASPVVDIAYFFYCCSTKSIIENHIHYINLYYQSFCEFLAQFGCDGHQLFPFEKLLEHWKLYGKYGLILSLIILKIMLSDKEEVPDLTEAAESGENIVNAFAFESSQEEIFLERLKTILEHFVDHNYL